MFFFSRPYFDIISQKDSQSFILQVHTDWPSPLRNKGKSYMKYFNLEYCPYTKHEIYYVLYVYIYLPTSFYWSTFSKIKRYVDIWYNHYYEIKNTYLIDLLPLQNLSWKSSKFNFSKILTLWQLCYGAFFVFILLKNDYLGYFSFLIFKILRPL